MSRTKVIILSDCNAFTDICNTIEANVDGYILKNDPPESVVQAIRAVMRGEVWYSQAAVQQILAAKRVDLVKDEVVQLSPRERQILALVAKGWNNTQIAAELNLAQQTIRNNLSNIYHILNVSTRAEAIVRAINHGNKGF